jgi:hypothetical protein
MTITIKGSSDADFPIVTITPSLDNPTSSSTTTGTSLDAAYSLYTANGVDSNALVDVKPANGYFSNFTVDTSTPSVASYDNNTKKLSMVGAGGNASIKVNTYGLGSKEYRVTVAHLGSATTRSETGGVAGTLMKHLWDSIATMISGKTASPTTMLCMIGNARNPSLFCNYDFTGRSTTNIMNTLVSSQHYICAGHAYGGGVGSVVSFIGSDNITYTRTIIATQDLTTIPDTRMGIYDSPLPASVKPFKLLPTNYLTRLPNLNHTPYSYPCLIICGHSIDSQPVPNQTTIDTLIVSEVTRTGVRTYGATGPTLQTYTFFPNQTTIFDTWGRKVAPYVNGPIDGDSNHPAFFPINGELVLLCNMLYGSENPDYASASGEIQTVMNTLSTANGFGASLKTLSFADLSSFTSF